MKDIETLILKLINNECSSDEFDQLMKLLKSSEENSHQIKAIMDCYWSDEHIAFNNATSHITFDQLWTKVHKQHTHRYWPVFLRIAASVLLVCGLVLIAYWSFSTWPPFAKYQTVATLDGQTARIHLPDGSRILLNEGSSVRYPSSFDSREITFSGEAYFEIVKNPEKPFRVLTRNGEIKVLGTIFNVKENRDSTLYVALTEGSVELHSGTKKTVLQPGEVGVLSKGQISVQATNNIANYLSWFNRHLVFENTPLKSITQQLEQIYQVKIVLPDGVIQQARLSFTMDRLPIHKVLEEIALTLHLELKVKDQQYELIAQ